MKTKEKVLQLLIKQQEDYLSGETIARSLDCSRTAIWKAIKELKNDGHTIESSTKKGYRYIPSDTLTDQTLQAELEKCGLSDQLHVTVANSLESTNRTLKIEAINGLKAPALLAARDQTKTVGRFSREYFAQPDQGIYFSLLLTPDEKITDVAQYTLMAAVATSSAIESLTGKKITIKWVNDLYYQEKKVCGILSEALTSLETKSISHVIIGIGINFAIAQTDFPKELQHKATSLYPDGKPAIFRSTLIAHIVKELMDIIQQQPNVSYLEHYREKLFVLQREVSFHYQGSLMTGTAKDINERGELIVILKDGSEIALSSGEISLLKY